MRESRRVTAEAERRTSNIRPYWLVKAWRSSMLRSLRLQGSQKRHIHRSQTLGDMIRTMLDESSFGERVDEDLARRFAKESDLVAVTISDLLAATAHAGRPEERRGPDHLVRYARLYNLTTKNHSHKRMRVPENRQVLCETIAAVTKGAEAAIDRARDLPRKPKKWAKRQTRKLLEDFFEFLTPLILLPGAEPPCTPTTGPDGGGPKSGGGPR